MNALPTLDDLNLLKAIKEVIREHKNESETLLRLKNAMGRGDLFINLPFSNDELFGHGRGVYITPFEFMLSGGDVKDINVFLTFLPKQYLGNKILPNLMKIKMDGIEHHPYTSYMSDDDYIYRNISNSINNRYEYGEVKFDDIVSFMLPLGKFHGAIRDKSCKKNDYIDLWKNLKNHGVEIQERHKENVYQTMYRFFNNGSFNKKNDFLLSIIENCPARWFLEEDFSKKINFILSRNESNDEDFLYAEQIKTLIEKKVLSLSIKNKSTVKKVGRKF